jgi:hypothetical protein
MSSNLLNLRDRFPAMFPRPEAPRKRGKGLKKRQMWAARFARYRDGLIHLVFRFDIAAERERLRAQALMRLEDEIAQTGGYERSPANG